MALACEFLNVVIRKSALMRHYPDGIDGFVRLDLANFVEDEHLVRVGYMSTREGYDLIQLLEAHGLQYLGNELDSDIAMFDGRQADFPAWLQVGMADGSLTCWASGFPAGDVVRSEANSFLLMYPRAIDPAFVEALNKSGAQVHELTGDITSGVIASFHCVRGDAEVQVDVLGEQIPDTPVVLWAARKFARRRWVAEDISLLRDLKSALSRAGAE